MLKHPLAVAILLVASGLTAAPTTNAAETELELPVQVSSATGYRQQALVAPASITVIEQDEIQSRPVSDLAEVLRDIPGVAIVDSGFPGMKRLSLRGESARRVLVKVNGQPVVDHSNYGTPLMIDPAMIERIEIVRGSASVVHGSNAIGGVIDIITRTPEQGEQLLLASAGYYSGTNGFRLSAGVLGGKDNVDYRLQAARADHSARRIPHAKLEGSSSYDKSFSGEIGARFGDARVAWQGDYFIQEVSAWADGSNGVDALGLPERSSLRNALSYENQLDGEVLKKVSAQVFYHEGKRVLDNEVTTTTPPPAPAMTVNVNNRSDDALTTAGAQLYFETQLLGDNVTLFGVEYLFDQLVTDKTTITNTTPPPGLITTTSQSLSAQSAEQNTWSAFVQQQLQLASNVEANLGVRYYAIQSDLNRSTERTKTDEYDDQLVGSASLVWQTTDHSSLRLNAAQGYTYPSLTQQFAVTAGGSDVHFGNPNLKAEKSTTYELGWRVDAKQFSLDATAYQSKAKDFIDRKSITAADVGAIGYNTTTTARQRLWQWINVAEADSYGAELAIAYQLGDWRPYSNVSVQERKLTFANGYSTRDSGLPSYMLRAGVQWEVRPNIQLDAFARSYGNSLRRDENGTVGALDESHRYVSWNLAAHYTATENLTIAAALNNLTNKLYQHPDELPAVERSLDVEVSWRF